jgi:hypothetical protein
VEQEPHILPEHANFWAIKKLCSFSWTFPENSRWPGSFYFYMMFMIPEVLVNFVMKNLDQGNIPSSRHQRDQKDQRGLKNLKITHIRAGNKKGYQMVLNGNIKGFALRSSTQ